MSVSIKKIGKGEYAYLVTREGQRVVHKYLGPVDSPKASKFLRDNEEVKRVPDRFSSLFWDTSLSNINIKKNARYIIERILELGDMEALNWMQKVYTVQTILDVLNVSRSISAKSKNFWEIWFENSAA